MLETTEYNKDSPLTEVDIKTLYNRLQAMLQDPKNRMIGLQSDEAPLEWTNRRGVMFTHYMPTISSASAEKLKGTHDSFSTLGIKTEHRRRDGGISTPAINISVKYPCLQKHNHEPTPIPENATIGISLAGMGETFKTDGTLQGSGISRSSVDSITQSLSRKPLINLFRKPGPREIFERYKFYVDNMDLQGLQRSHNKNI